MVEHIGEWYEALDFFPFDIYFISAAVDDEPDFAELCEFISIFEFWYLSTYTIIILFYPIC